VIAATTPVTPTTSEGVSQIVCLSLERPQ